MLLFFLLFDTNTFDALDEILGTTIKDRKFRTVYLNEAIVDSASKESCHSMFYRAYFHSVLHKYSATCGFSHIISISIDNGLLFNVNSLDFIAEVFRSRRECNCQIQTRMQSLTAK